MRSFILSAKTLSFAVLLLSAGPNSSRAQQRPAPITFAVRAISHDTTDRPLQLAASDALTEALMERGAVVADTSQWTFLVAATLVAGDRVALSVAALGNLPGRIVDWAGEQEIFYAVMSDATRADLPEEGTFIRRYVSEEYMRQFAMPQDLDVVVVDRSDLSAGAREMARRFFERHIHW